MSRYDLIIFTSWHFSSNKIQKEENFRYFLALWKVSIPGSTYSVTRFFCFLTPVRTKFWDFIQNENNCAPFEHLKNVFQNAAKLLESTGGTIRTFIVAVIVNKSKTSLEFIFLLPNQYAWIFVRLFEKAARE